MFPGGFLFQNHYPRFRGAPAGFFKGCPQGPPSADSGLGNANQLEQVFINLFQNAVHALADKREDAKITVDFAPVADGTKVQASFADNGMGMEPERIDRIFEPFFTTKPVGQGTGLGLSLVHGIITDHGGTITCESTLNKGTTFIITLLVAEGTHG